MAEKTRDETGTEEKKKKKEEKKEEKKESGERVTSIARIMSTDVPGNKKICYGLTRIKGVSFSFAVAVCNALGIQPKRTISSLSEEEIKKIVDFINNPKLPAFLLNRRRDIESGQNKHLTGINLELSKDFDIKRLKQIRSYKGWRHAIGLPVRGQRTKSHFRHGKSVGVVKTKRPASGKKAK